VVRKNEILAGYTAGPWKVTWNKFRISIQSPAEDGKNVGSPPENTNEGHRERNEYSSEPVAKVTVGSLVLATCERTASARGVGSARVIGVTGTGGKRRVLSSEIDNGVNGRACAGPIKPSDCRKSKNAKGRDHGDLEAGG